MSTSSSETGVNLATLQTKVTSKRHSRPRRWIIGATTSALILIGAAIAYVFLNTQVAPLALPKLPANLSDSQIGLARWQEYQLPLPPHPLDNSLLPTMP